MNNDGALHNIICDMHDDEGFTPEEIAETMNVHIDVVTAVLAKGSSEYRLSVSAETGSSKVYDVIDDRTFRRICKGLVDIALDADKTPPAVRAKTMMWLIDEKKGRNDDKKDIKPLNENILALTSRLNEIEDKRRRMLAEIRDAEVVSQEPKQLELATK